MKYIGIDIGKIKCVACIMDDDGTVLEQTKYENTLEDAESFASNMRQKYGQCVSVCESTGNLWIKTYEAFEKHGIVVKLANPVKTRAIAEAQIKTDTVDSQILAHLLRTNLVAECFVAPREIRENRIILRQRTGLVQNRTAIVNRIRSLLDKYDLKHTHDRIHGTTGIRWLKEISLESASDNISLQQYTRHVEFLNDEIASLERQIASDAAKKESVAILMSMTGIDYYSAMLITSEIGEISRFQTPKKLVSWAGLCPSLHQSGDSLYHGKIKKGNKKIQSIMTQAANTASRTDERMKQFYVRIAKKHGHNVSITHVANKMMIIIWHMLTEKTLYSERKENLYQEKLKRINSKYWIS